MMRIEEQARRASGLGGTDVIAAWDLMDIQVPMKVELETSAGATHEAAAST